jgi:hypothetical protein
MSKEAISASDCLHCGHLISDHHRAGQKGIGRTLEVEHARGARDHCIGDGDTCSCRKFVQPHNRIWVGT